MNEPKPEDVMRALENGRYIDADELWNNRPENINKEGSFIDGWFYCLDRFSRHLKEMIDKPSVVKAALALLREKDAEIDRLYRTMDMMILESKEKDAEIERLTKEHAKYVEDVTVMLSEKNMEVERLMREKTALECVVSTARNQGRAKAIDEFAQRVLALRVRKSQFLFVISRGNVDHIAKEMKGVTNGSDNVH